MVCRMEDDTEKRLPLADILAVIVAARGVSFSANAISACLCNNIVIIHCDSNYRPVGKTVALNYIVQGGVFESQISLNKVFAAKLWYSILQAKISNQAFILDSLKVEHKLHSYIAQNALDEGNAARHYWSFYFKNFGRSSPKTRERKGARDPVNGMLNYGYAVLSAILHRALVAHGLNTSLGIYHKYRFKSDPLVYDLLEPLRPICDLALLSFVKTNPRKEIDDFVKYVAAYYMSCKIKTDKEHKLSLFSAIDLYASGIANAFARNDIKDVFIPTLKEVSFGEKQK